MHRDEHVDVDEVSDPSIANQDLRHLNRLSQIAQSNVHWHFRNDINLKATHVLKMAKKSLTAQSGSQIHRGCWLH